MLSPSFDPVKVAIIEALPGIENYHVEVSTEDPKILANMLGSFAAQIIADGYLTGDEALTCVIAAVDSELE